jgi:hypothetical protein
MDPRPQADKRQGRRLICTGPAKPLGQILADAAWGVVTIEG